MPKDPNKLSNYFGDIMAMINDDDNPTIESLNRYPTIDQEDSEFFITSEEIVKSNKIPNVSGDRRLPTVDVESDESIHFKRYSKRRDYKYTELEMEAIRNSCINTIVHDYSEHDVYHMSDEDRVKNDQLAEVSMKLLRLKRIYRRADQYIEAMRIVYEAWTILEKSNYIHPIDEFFQMVAEEKIVSSRIPMPKLKNLDKYNLDMIINYISNPELDVSHFAPKKDELRYDESDDEDDDDTIPRCISLEEMEYIQEHENNPDRMEVGTIPRKYIRGYNQKRLKKKMKKKDRVIKENLSRLLNKIQYNQNKKDIGYNSYMITNNLFEEQDEPKSFMDDMRYGGSWRDDVALELYDIAIEQRLLEQPAFGERYLTIGDKRMTNLYAELEKNGVNVIELRRRLGMGDIDNNKKIQRMKKRENKQMESNIIQRITKLNQNKRFQKIAKKAEESLNNYRETE